MAGASMKGSVTSTETLRAKAVGSVQKRRSLPMDATIRVWFKKAASVEIKPLATVGDPPF